MDKPIPQIHSPGDTFHLDGATPQARSLSKAIIKSCIWFGILLLVIFVVLLGVIYIFKI